MLTAREKRKQNIAEYILYMWQTEDQIRAFGMDIDEIQKYIIDQYQTDETTKEEIRKWYKDLILMMETERIQNKGHLQILKNIIIDLYDLHLRLLKMPGEMKYKEQYFRAVPHIQNLEQKMPGQSLNDLDTCLHGLYGVLLLRIAQKPLSPETEESVKEFSKWMARLAQKYNEREKDPDSFL